jgi:hypothetical protein
MIRRAVDFVWQVLVEIGEARAAQAQKANCYGWYY